MSNFNEISCLLDLVDAEIRLARIRNNAGDYPGLIEFLNDSIVKLQIAKASALFLQSDDDEGV